MFCQISPNGTSVGLTVREPRMRFEDFMSLVKEEYSRLDREPKRSEKVAPEDAKPSAALPGKTLETDIGDQVNQTMTNSLATKQISVLLQTV